MVMIWQCGLQCYRESCWGLARCSQRVHRPWNRVNSEDFRFIFFWDVQFLLLFFCEKQRCLNCRETVKDMKHQLLTQKSFFLLLVLRTGSVKGWKMTVNGWCLIATWPVKERKNFSDLLPDGRKQVIFQHKFLLFTNMQAVEVKLGHLSENHANRGTCSPIVWKSWKTCGKSNITCVMTQARKDWPRYLRPKVALNIFR